MASLVNKEFVKKMIKAKKLEYEAIKEVLPEEIKEKVDNLEIEAMDIIKDIAIEILKEENVKNTEENKAVKKINIG